MSKEIKFRIIKKQNGCRYGGKPFYVVKYKRKLFFWRHITTFEDTIDGSISVPKTFETIDEAKHAIKIKLEELKLYELPKKSDVVMEFEI